MMDTAIASRLIIGVVLALAVVGKAAHLSWFSRVVQTYVNVSERRAIAIGLTVITTESVLAILLISGIWQPWPAVASFALLMLFTMLTIRQLAAGRIDADCGCGGPHSGETIGLGAILRNVGLLGITWISMVGPALPRGGLWLASFLVLLGLPALFGRRPPNVRTA